MKPLNEDKLSVEKLISLFYQLIKTLCKLHERNMVHLDIKPSNLMINPKTEDLCLIDFGYSTYCPPGGVNFSDIIGIGTDGYIAPELLDENDTSKDYQENYSYTILKVDIYSSGITLLRLLLPHIITITHQNTDHQLLKNDWDSDIYFAIKETLELLSQYLITNSNHNNLLSHAHDLILKMINENPYSRPSAKEILQHPLFLQFQENYKKQPKINFQDIQIFNKNHQKRKKAKEVNMVINDKENIINPNFSKISN